MDTFARLLTLLTLLQRQPTWTGEDLAERLAVTPRTIRRDVAKLRDLGYVVDAEPGRYGGYRLVGGRALPPLALADDEAVAVAVALREAAGSSVAGVGEAAVTALAKLEQVLPARLRERVRALDDAIERLAGAPQAAVDADVLVALAHACRGRERVRCAYTDGRGRRTRRDLEPHRLVQAQRRWYLVAFDRGRDDWRTLRVDRVREVQPQGVPAEARRTPDPLALVARAITVLPYRWHATVRLESCLDLARSVVPSTVGHVEAEGEAVLLHIGADHLDWLARYLVGLGIPFRVIEPPELRQVLVSLGAELADRFADPTGGRS